MNKTNNYERIFFVSVNFRLIDWQFIIHSTNNVTSGASWAFNHRLLADFLRFGVVVHDVHYLEFNGSVGETTFVALVEKGFPGHVLLNRTKKLIFQIYYG